MDPLTSPPPAPTIPAAPGGTGTARGVLSSDFETFLKMLTTQMRNQDPLNPVDSADFAVQLATFSSVEQQVQTNDLLTDLSRQIATLGMGQLTGWIGLEAEVAGPVHFTGAPLMLGVTVVPGAEAAELVVTDARGIIVQREEIAPQSGPVIWQGRDSLGHALPSGEYRIAVHALVDGETIARDEAHLHGRITEARLEAGAVRLVLETGQSVAASEVLGLRPLPPVAQ